MKVRRANSSDAKTIAEIFNLAFIANFRTEENASELHAYVVKIDAQYFESCMLDQKQVFFVAEEEQGLTGFAQGIVEAPYPDRDIVDWIKLERLYVRPEQVRRGAGTALIKHLMSHASDNDAAHIWLQVLRTNEKAVSFYQRLGFVKFDMSPGKFKADNEIDLWMKRSTT